MEPEVTYGFEDEEQFWTVLEETVSRECDTHDSIDDTLRSYIDLIGSCRERFSFSDHDLGQCAFKLQESALFAAHSDYIRRQFIHCLIEDDEAKAVLSAASFLIADAHSNEGTYQLLNDEGAFPRLVDLISSPKQHGHEDIHRLLMELLYDMSRIQRIKLNDLAHVSDDFVSMLFDIIEVNSADVNDPYHYPIIRVLLVLNEQYMVTTSTQPPTSLTNKVIKVLSTHGNAYKTFGENIILLLNREDETSLQLLTLKLLYLLFTTPPTYEYFYTNDLRVLVDILIRNLLDLPEEATSLRHTYLRVLYPLLEHTQLQQPPYYKRDAIRKLLLVLGGGHLTDQIDSPEGLRHWGHFDDIDQTTKRLVKRCEGVTWLSDPETEPPIQAESPIDDDVASELSSPTSPSKSVPPALPAPRKLKKRNSTKTSILTIGQYLTPQLEGARQSSLSMMEVAAQTEKPGVITPSRNPALKNNLREAIMQKEKPPPPQARRSGFLRMKAQRMETEVEIAKAKIPEAESAATNPLTEEHQDSHRHRHHPPLPFHHHHHRHEKPPTDTADKGKEKEKEKPPPIPSHHRGLPFRKPPPAPKARRRRGREGTGDSTREPGKFSANLPSIITTTTSGEKKVLEDSPFSPKTLSPSEPDSSSTIESRAKLPVSEALEKAQAMIHEEIEETLEHIELQDQEFGDGQIEKTASLEPLQEGEMENSEDVDRQDEYEDVRHKPDKIGAHSQEEIEQPFHDAVTNQALAPSHTISRTPSYLAQSQNLLSPHTNEEPATPAESNTPSITTNLSSAQAPTSRFPFEQEELPMPTVILTPPAQQPSRGVPGPQFEIERSPFLTDEEVEEETDLTDDEEADSPAEKR